ncbi:ferrochelatase [Haliscomenobacter hydrossis]|uniref:Ferrochelatase n=1 Tax=Haliscomenobacter hydrossis (strain ATCC 27775 / DSM 1100 / LMG 10767 / O) TaxID=760192 RepID=F4L2E0_HALH1|nr:ferrochelatase [Haliscomenobacter hydrossis]AEE52893.1 Ferrochelatase [Haliscomenobacter hydrossis DSM 1100]
MVFGKKGILLVNLGTPNSPSRGDVYVYLRQFLTDPRVIDIPWVQRQVLVNGIIAPFRSGSSAKLYQELWTPEGSPIKIYGERVAAGLQALLGDEYAVALGMRYQNPSIESALKQLIDQQVSEITVFPMFPQYASASTGSVHDEVMRLLRKEQVIPNVRFINSYYDHDPMIEIFADNARKFDIASYDHILFSFHGLPQRQMIKADACNHCLKTANCCETVSIKNQFCYSAQSHGTAYALAKKLNLTRDRYTISFQSRLGRDPWIQPYTIEVLEKLAKQGAKRLLVFSAAFVADCLETIVEISSEYQEEFHKMGGETVDLVPSLNDDPRWIKVIADMVR